MAKTKISEWDVSPGNNAEIDGINLAEGGMTPSAVNNAIREIMSQVAEFFGGTKGDLLPLSAGGTGASSAAGARTALGLGDLATMDLADIIDDISTGTETITAGENLADRDQIYQDVFNQRGNGADRWYKIDADATGPVKISPRIGVALEAINAAATGMAQVLPGRVSGFSGLTAGAPCFVSATAGGVTQTVPPVPATGTQIAVRRIGYAASATEIDFDPEPMTQFMRADDALAAGSGMTIEHWPDAGAPDRELFASLLASVVSTTASNSGSSIVTNNWLNYNTRCRVAASQISTSGSKIRLTLAAYSGVTFTDVFIGEAGTNYNFAGTPTRVTFGGSNGGTIGSGAELVSDDVAFALDETKDYIVSCLLSGSGTGSPYATNDGGGWTGWYKTGANLTDTQATSPSGTYTSGFAPMLRKLEVVQPGRREKETLFAESRWSAATDKITNRYDDGAGADADTKSTIINRSGATRALVGEVVL